MKPDTLKRICAEKLRGILFIAVPSGIFLGALCNLPSLKSAAYDSGLWMPPKLEDLAKGVAIYDRHDRYICTVYDGKDKETVPLSAVSPNMKLAILAAEDQNFYKHPGLDALAIARAVMRNWQAGEIVEGASTISQQLARTLYLNSNDRSFKRKLFEAYLALQLEARYPKDKILEVYLNEIYFGKGAYGIERAANLYFNKKASQLSIAESAFLAGAVRSPSLFARKTHKGDALTRRNQVIEAMLERGFITITEAEQAKSERLAFKEGSHRLRYPHYVSHVLNLLEREIGPEIWTKGYKAYTYLDPAIQQLAEANLNKGMKRAPKGLDQAALVTMEVKSGAVLALVGGLGPYSKNEWNRATHPHTAGSAFKPFVYLSALANGILDQDSLVADTPLTIDSPGAKTYRPKNFDGGFAGWMTVREAIARSRNICALRVALATGLASIADTARAAGISTQLQPYPSTALGACAISPLDMTEAYATIARTGERLAPQFIRRIESRDGYAIKQYHATPTRVFDAEVVAQLTDALEDVVQRGTGTRARLKGIPVAGKTGTADKSKDVWFIGFTPLHVTTLWAGSDKNKAVAARSATGGQVLAGLWKDYMAQVYAREKPPVKLAFAEPRRPLLKSIPLYSDDYLLGYSSSNKAIGHTSSITLHTEVNASGIASATTVQKIAADRRRQIAEEERWKQYLSSLERLSGAVLPSGSTVGGQLTSAPASSHDVPSNTASQPAMPLAQPTEARTPHNDTPERDQADTDDEMHSSDIEYDLDAGREQLKATPELEQQLEKWAVAPVKHHGLSSAPAQSEDYTFNQLDRTIFQADFENKKSGFD